MKIAAFITMALLMNTIAAQALLERDSNLQVEKLDNGMTIAVYRNLEPPGRVSMRLLIRKGSLCETESEKGIAHFVEHMAFNGTKRFPSGDMVEYFQRLGMAFGADTNAHTGFSETVYKLDMPDTSQKLISDGLMLLRDYCDGILFEPASIDSERGVIIAEKKSRDNQDYRRAVKEIALYFKGTRFADRMPIGDESVISSVRREDFLKFYGEAYAPQNAVLVVVGDVDPAEIFAAAKKAFADFKERGGQDSRADNFGALETAENPFAFAEGLGDFDADYDCTPNAPKSYSAVAVSGWTAGEKDSLERRVREIRIRVLASAITARYLKISESPGSKISGGAASAFNFEKCCRTFMFTAEAPVGRGADSLAENFRQILGAAENISQAEIDNAKQKLIDSIESDLKSWKTRKNPQVANEIVSAFSNDEVFTSPETDLKIAEYALSGFTAADAKALLRGLFDGAKMKVFISDVSGAPKGKELGEIVSKAYSEALESGYDSEIFAPKNLIFDKFSGSGEVVEREQIEDLSILRLRFRNGVRLNLKKTDFSKDEILMKISFGDGLLDIPADRPEYYVGVYALACGGTKYQSFAEISAAQFLLKMSLSAGVDGNSFFVAGGSTRKDFGSLVRLSATMFSAPGFRGDGLESLMKYAEAFYLDYRSEPMSKMRFAPIRLIASPIAEVPGSLEKMSSVKMEDLKNWLSPILAKSYMEISVVGDIDLAEAEKLFSETFGTLPARDPEKRNPYAAVEIKKSPLKMDLFYDTVDEPRSVASVSWFSGGREDVKSMRVANVLGAVLDDVLRKDIREKGGKVYSPFAYNAPSTWMRGVGFINAATFVVPEANSELLAALEKCGKKLLDGISEDEFERAKIPLLKGVEANLRRNSYWLEAVMNLSQARPVNIELARTIVGGYESVSLDDVKKEAEKIFSQPSYSISVMPDSAKASTESRASDAGKPGGVSGSEK